MSRTFGAFLARKHYERDIKYKELAKRTGISAQHLSDMIQGRRNPTANSEKIEKIATVLELSESEKWELYDCIGNDRREVSPDLTEYVMQEATLRAVLRKAQRLELGDEFWQEVIEKMEAAEKNTNFISKSC